MKLLYIVGPYRGSSFHEIELHIAQAREAAEEIVTLGAGFICPHLNSAHFEVIMPDTPEQFWLDMTREMLRRSDGLYVLLGYGHSEGSLGEILEAQELQLPVFFQGNANSIIALKDWISIG